MDSNLVVNLNYVWHLILLILMSSGVNLLAQTYNKHLLQNFQNHLFDHFHYLHDPIFLAQPLLVFSYLQ